MIDISYIVSAYNRPKSLVTCLASLVDQSHDNFEVIVTDNADDDQMANENRKVVQRFKDNRLFYFRTTKKIKISDCYWSAEWAINNVVKGKYLCFPCDDCYYVPTFGEKMLNYSKLYGWDLVCCDVLYRWNSGQHGILYVKPDRALGTKTSFIVNSAKFNGFRMKPKDKAAPCAADATALLDICKDGTKWGTVQQVLVVHN